MNIPLRRVAAVSGAMLFALLANASYIQIFQVAALEADVRNQRVMLAKFNTSRGDLLLRDGTVLATSKEVRSRYRYQRVYPEGPLYSAVTGFVSLYRDTGVEQAEDQALSGNDPRVKVRTLLKDTARGASVTLTLDARAQRAAYEGLRATGKHGAVVAVDPATGAILAMTSFPAYDPNDFATFDPEQLARIDKELQADPAKPLLNRATSQNYPPGSAFKVVTAAAALDSGKYAPGTPITAPPRLKLPGTSVFLGNAGGGGCGNGSPPLAQAFQMSCNTAFATLGLVLGQDALRRQATAFGFGDESLTVPLAVVASRYPERMDRAQTAMSAIGQFDDRVTPLELALISAAVANDGVLMRPYLVDEIRLTDGTMVSMTDPEEYRETMPGRVAEQLTEMMVSVTQPGGTGTAAAIPGVEVAAKTGTAENDGSDHAVFTAFAPASRPRVAVGVLVEHGGFGGEVAAPIAKAVIEALL
ncbi:D,D-transpeptidase PbpA [Acrocarpospora macrocephala]|uniref:Putative penicillin-binding protein PbpA n=1 Tax=Acrocarpospora macrocephala TaxID=150177 RepID=A0A5M3WNJ5_9ACTN|nr:penicillin-binding protein 2 [Acrocarpospora macrocephala]GES10867.1 putative penicillin-binding protein PbpA [Acrocarpospora macrocephala]